MKRPVQRSVKPKITIFILTLLCIFLLLLSATYPTAFAPVKNAVGAVVVPLQKGVNKAGSYIYNRIERRKTVEELQAKNEKLQKQIDELTQENSILAQSKYELEKLQELYEMDKDYNSYPKVAARVIARNTSPWFDTFIINRGSEDGIKIDMNVIGGGGLVGIVYDVGKNYAKVRSIIDDESSVSVSFARSTDTAIVSGDLTLIEDGILNVTRIPKDADVSKGDMVVTSQLSSKFLPGILVGYIDDVKLDSNELLQSGTITPVVDFKHIDEVLVITELKENPADEK